MALDAHGDLLLGPPPLTREEFDAQVASAMRVVENDTSANKPMPKLPQIRGMCSGCIYESDTGNSACNCCQRNPVFDDYYEVATSA